MIILADNSSSFKTLLIASEILIPVIIFVGAYFIFRPMIKRNKELLDEEKRKSEE